MAVYNESKPPARGDKGAGGAVITTPRISTPSVSRTTEHRMAQPSGGSANERSLAATRAQSRVAAPKSPVTSGLYSRASGS